MAQPKPLFIPWLKQQIDSGRYPGVQWVNQECTKFSIPWKHALRQDSNSDDILIFRVNLIGIHMLIMNILMVSSVWFILKGFVRLEITSKLVFVRKTLCETCYISKDYY